jgi:hypothetical protein
VIALLGSVHAHGGPAHAAGPTSLLAITAAQLHDARQRHANSTLFEVQTSITPANVATGIAEIPYVFGAFADPGDNTHYVSIQQWFGQRSAYTMRTLGFVHTACRGGANPGPEMQCGKETGQSEPHRFHLPLQGWKVDLPDVLRVLKAAGYSATNYSHVTVTTAGRARAGGVIFGTALARLPDGYAIITVVESGSGARSQYACIDAGTGKVLGIGTYMPRRPPV